MRSRYRTIIVRASRMDGGGPIALQEQLEAIPVTERLHSVLRWAQGGGYTDAWIIITEPITHS
jgi:hypothetical protein